MNRTDPKNPQRRSPASTLQKPQRSLSVSPEAHSRSKATTASKDAGAVDEEQFREAFAITPTVLASCGSEVEKELMHIREVLSKTSEDWEKRVDQLRKLRGLVVGGAAGFKEFNLAMRYVDLALQTSVRDLRSQVVREACITMAFLAESLRMDCERTAEMVLPSLLLLIPNSVKVMASSGIVAARFVITYVQSHKLIPIITQECVSSKSKETRRMCCEFVKLIISTFPKATLERHLAGIRDAIKKSMSDADSEARAIARQSYPAFAAHFPAQARELYRELDSAKQKLLDEVPSFTSSQNSVATSNPTTPAGPRLKPVVKSTTMDAFMSTMRIPARTALAATGGAGGTPLRSISAVDTAAARRARMKLLPQFSAQPPPVVASAGVQRFATPQFQRSFRKYAADKKPFLTTQKLPVRNGEQSGSAEQIDHFPEERVHNLVDEVPDIVEQLSSTNWIVKEDGLLSLQQYLLHGNSFLSNELDVIRTSLTRMMNDPSTKLVSLLFDTLYDFVRIHNLQLGSWLYVLLSKLWNKQGGEMAPSVQVRLHKLLDLIRASFPAETQLQLIFRYVTDQAQIPGIKVKVAILNYLSSLVQSGAMQSEDVKNSSLSRLGVAKLIGWCIDAKAPEVRKHAQQTLVLLSQLNTHEFNEIMHTQNQQTQDAALKLMATFARRSSGVATDERTVKKTTPLKPQPLKTNGEVAKRNDENANPAVVSRSGGYLTNAMNSMAQLTSDVDRIRLNGNAHGAAIRQASPNRALLNGAADFIGMDAIPDQVQYLTTWSEKFKSSAKTKQGQMLDHLHRALPNISEQVWEEHFMIVLPMLYDLLHSVAHDSEIMAGTLICFADLLALQSERMRQFPELTVVNLLEVQRGATKTVARVAEDCIKLAVRTFPCDVIVKILTPIITNQPHPENSNAVRFFGVMCQEVTPEALHPVLPMIIPILVTAYAESDESTMRKECVYALIHAQLTVGDQLLKPYLDQLPKSKVRLMSVYLKRVVQQDSQ